MSGSGSLALLGAAVVLFGGGSYALAQTQPPAVPSPGSSPGVPATNPPGAPAEVASPGFLFGIAEVPIVGGNLASARERGIAEALKQAVGQAIVNVAPEAPAAQPKAVAQILGKARVFVRRYRSIEEGEVRVSRYAVKLEAEVDETALRRALDRAMGSPQAGTGTQGAASYFVAPGGVVEGTDAVVRALSAGGARAERAPVGAWDQPRAVEAAARAGLSAVAFVNASASAEGQVRGPGVEAVSCTIALRVLAAASGAPVGEDSQTTRGFGSRVEEARKDCFARAAAVAVSHAVPQWSGVHGGADLRTVIVDADVAEAGAVQPLLKQLRGSGSVSSVDLRRIVPGRLEIWVRSRLTGPALAALLARDGTGAVTISGAEAVGDRVRLQARLKVESPPPPAPSAAAPGAPPAPGGAKGGGTP